MKKLLYGMLAFLTIAGIQSCSTSNDVVSNGLLQKRKFNKGYHYAGLAKGAEKASKLNNSTAVTTVNEVKTNTPLLQASIKNTPSAAIANRTPTKTIAPNVFESNTTTLSLTQKELTKLLKKEVKKQKNVFNKANPKPSTGIGDSQFIALILVVCLGGLGIHRFYLGYYLVGILQLLTAGGCLIWWLIDLIRIITGDLGPKNSTYTETL